MIISCISVGEIRTTRRRVLTLTRVFERLQSYEETDIGAFCVFQNHKLFILVVLVILWGKTYKARLMKKLFVS